MFIVLEGLDGAGKSTQIRMLRQLFADRGVESEYVHFPRFDSPVYGQLIARFLRGEFGGVQEVDPYLVALIFAGDRADAAPQIRQWLAEGKAVVLDRYVYSNVGFQCAKLPAGEERDRLADWIVNLEFGHNALPRPDLSLFLDVPFAFTERKLSEVREGDDRVVAAAAGRAQRLSRLGGQGPVAAGRRLQRRFGRDGVARRHLRQNPCGINPNTWSRCVKHGYSN